MLFSIPLLIMFTLYMVCMVTIGIYAYRKTTNFTDYILGGRKLGRVVTALSAGASDMSAWLLMGLPGAIFLFGLNKSWIAIGLILGAYLNWTFVAGRLRVQTEQNQNALTLPDYFAARFEDKGNFLRLFSAIIILIFFTLYCASGIVAGAKLFELIFAISYGKALLAGAMITIFYTFIGGFFAVSWSDTLQATLMLFALIIVPVMVIMNLGGLSTTLAEIKLHNPQGLNLFNNISGITIVSLLGWGLGYCGQPHILARFMAADSAKVVNQAKSISMSWMVLCLCGAVAIGLVSIAYFDVAKLLAAGQTEQVFILLTTQLFNPWIAGILLSAILAAIMSTLSCQLLVCSSALTEDLYRIFFRKDASQTELVWVGRMMVLLVALIGMLLAINPQNSILGLVGDAWAGFGAAFGPLIIASLFWSRVNFYGAVAGMLVGTLVVIVWSQFNWFELYALIPGFVLSGIAIISVSLMTAPPSQHQQQQFKLANQRYHNER